MERAVSDLSKIKSDTEKAVYVLSKIKIYMDERSYEDDDPSTFFDADVDEK